MLKNFDFRPATEQDLGSILAIVHMQHMQGKAADFLYDYAFLSEAILNTGMRWYVIESANSVIGFLYAHIDVAEGLAKINFAAVSSKNIGKQITQAEPTYTSEAENAALKFLLQESVEHFAAEGIEVIYLVSRTAGLPLQLLSLELGFKLAGILADPAISLGTASINGLAVLHLGNTLRSARDSGFNLHPLIQELAQLTNHVFGLPPIQVSKEIVPFKNFTQGKNYPLEEIRAPAYVEARFQAMTEQRWLSSTFYPFQTPNTILSSPKREVEVFVRVLPSGKLATVIGEHITQEINPAELFKTICETLYRSGVTFVEVINDAGDAVGNEYLIQAGFVPSAYFPAMKRIGNRRRDYVVFSRSHEIIGHMVDNIPAIYGNYLNLYVNKWVGILQN